MRVVCVRVRARGGAGVRARVCVPGAGQVGAEGEDHEAHATLH